MGRQPDIGPGNHGRSIDDTVRLTRAERKQVVRGERWELLEHLTAILEPAMAVLGLLFLALLLVDYASPGLGARAQTRLDNTLLAIWAVFLLDFVLRFVIAPAKLAFLRHNWLAALSLAVPFLRPLRAFQAVRALRSLSLVRFLGGINRGMRVTRAVTRGRQFALVGLLTVLVVLAGAVGVLSFDRAIPGAPIQTFGDALWWSAAMVTTINNEKFAVSPEARVIAILERIYAVSVFGYITASIASYLIGPAQSSTAVDEETTDLQAEVTELRHEVVTLREALRRTGGDIPSHLS